MREGPFALITGALLLFCAPAIARPYRLVENFTNALPSNAQLRFSTDFEQPKVGLAAARLEYRIPEGSKSAAIGLPSERMEIPEAGQLRLWVHGDNSGAALHFVLHTARINFDRNGRRYLSHTRGFTTLKCVIDFEGWKEITFDVKEPDKGWTIWWSQLVVEPAKGEDAIREGVLGFDDLRLYPPSAQHQAVFVADLLGPRIRSFSREIAFALDLRSFVDKPATVHARVSMTDRNENLVVDRDTRIELPAQGAREVKLELAPENLEAYLPPFQLKGDVLSTDLSSASVTIDTALVMGNAQLLVDDFADLYGRWFTTGMPPGTGRGWIGWTMGETQRASAFAQTTAAISRVKLQDLPPPAETGQETEGGIDPGQPKTPPGRYALKLDYTGEAYVFNGFDRNLAGDAYRLGVWVRGNGTNDRLNALIMDFTDGGDFWAGGWKRYDRGLANICTLDFEGWRYFEFSLPGDGVGTNLPRGSTHGIDFPLELTAFQVETKTHGEARTVHLGPVFVHTQVEATSTLSLLVGYDDPDHTYAPGNNAWVTVQNGRWTGARKIAITWALLDREDQILAKGRRDAELPGREQTTLEIDLRSAKVAGHDGPLKLQVVASDLGDLSVSTTRELVLSKPDSEALLTGFETERDFIQLSAYAVSSQHAGKITGEQAHSGAKSLSIMWEKMSEEEQKARAQRRKPPGEEPNLHWQWVPVDPPLPGVPTELSLWVHGDGSGVLFHPVIGTRRGVRHGAGPSQFNLLHPRTVDGPLQDAVKVDWQGWRQLRFRMPVIPPTWPQEVPIPRWVPSYPLGLHLALDASAASTEKGTIFVDDISVTTHLEASHRLTMGLQRIGESSVVTPGSRIQVWVANRDASATRKARLSGGLFDWRNERVVGHDEELSLKPGERREIEVAGSVPSGFYLLRVALSSGEELIRSIDEDVLVTDVVRMLGDNWRDDLQDEWKLRIPINDRYTFVDEDWDWVEHYPGNLQVDTIRDRAGKISERGAAPYVLLGYSAYWAAGEGYEALMSSRFVRRQRDIGHAVDTFLKPARLEDWDHYCCEVMRRVGKELSGFVLWNNPESSSSLGVKPSRFAEFIKSADKWRRVYCPETPMVIGGMGRETAIPYLAKLAEHGALDHLSGVNVRMDVGRLSPEDARVEAYLRQLKTTLETGNKGSEKTIVLTDLDWAVEKDPDGLDGFDQAAYLVRSDLLLHTLGIRPVLSIRNDDYVRLGLGLTYRTVLQVPPMTHTLPTYHLKPAWWAIYRTRGWLDQLGKVSEIEVQDVVPGRTRCLLARRKADNGPVAMLWRNNDPGACTFSPTGLNLASAEDMLGTPLPSDGGWYPIGKLPAVFVLGPAEDPEQNLARLRVRDHDGQSWPQQVIQSFSPLDAGGGQYEQRGGERAEWQGRNSYGDTLKLSGLQFGAGGSERLSIPVPKGSELVLRKRFHLGEQGQEAEVLVNGQPAGIWDLRRADTELSRGFRESIFFLEKAKLAGKELAEIEIRYRGPANTIAWAALEYRDGAFPLSAVGPIHADQNVAHPFLARNVIGSALRVSETAFRNGIGVFARSLLEYSLNGQFSTFTAKVGVDAATEGKGSVEFEVYADGKKVWSSGVMSGLDEARDVDLDIKGVQRLRLVVTDGGDGNKFDAANWCEPELHR